MAEIAIATGTKVGEEVVDSLFTKVKKEIGYMWNCKENVEKLRSEVGKLKNMKERVEQKIKLALDNGDGLLAGVENWVKEALDLITKAEEFLQEEVVANKTCFNLRICVNLRTLYHYGKEATTKVSSLKDHQEHGTTFDQAKISIPNASPGTLELLPRENIDDLDTHKLVLEKIIESVKSRQITGIWGTGGIGKTKLATEVAARVKDLFALVIFVTVSRPVDAEKIKKDVDVAAKRIIKGEKVLIILDDVWDHLKLHTVGIPSETNHPDFKILLTSRERDVCKAMNAQEIRVEFLPIEEAWILFKRVVSEKLETDANLKKVVREIVEGCGGLPLILQAVGKALKDEENVKKWEHARDSIKKHKTSDIAPSISLEFANLRLSYDYLKSEEEKSIFLLCCMFPEDYHISIEKLACYGVGFQLFDVQDSLKDAIIKVQRAVRNLKSSCLLLDVKDVFGSIDESTTKMHDVVRQVALLIASKDKNFLVEAGKNLERWEAKKGRYERYTHISLMRNDICKLPASSGLNLPLLKIFLIQENYNLHEISDEFILAMKEVQVIDFEHNNISYLPESLKQLKRLRVLNLGGNKRFCDVSKLGELEDLEILILSDTGIKEIPQEFGKLVNLRLFHAERCPGLSHIESGVLSKLSSLEELSIQYKGKNNCLVEIGELLNLTSLKLWVQHICLIPEVDYLKRLKSFSIQFGGEEDYSYYGIAGITLILSTLDYADINSHSHVTELIKVCNRVVLASIKNIDEKMPILYCGGFSLKAIDIIECDNLLYLVDSSVLDKMPFLYPSENRKFLSEVEHLTLKRLNSLKVIWNCPDKYISLNNLVTILIWNCPKLEKLFSVSVAEGLVNLKRLTIRYCKSLKEVISDRDGETSTSEIVTVVPAKNIVFHRLAWIWLDDMKSLTSFYPGNATIKYPSLVSVWISGCDKMEKWGYGTHDTPNLQFVEFNVTKVKCSTIDEAMAKFREAEELRKKQNHDALRRGPAGEFEEREIMYFQN